jgi:hypothetical protein
LITFKYSFDKKYIRWEATWDGKHDNTWYDPKTASVHPFEETLDYMLDPIDAPPAGMVDRIGDVVADNPVTRELCAMLSQPEELHKHSGNVAVYWYWKKLIGSLSHLWD